MFNLTILAKSESYYLGHEYETVVLVERASGVEQVIADHYGDPTCAVIGPDETWAIVGGEGVTFFDFKGGRTEFFRKGSPPIDRSESTWFVHDMRLDGPDKVRILFDPWSKYASVWLLRCLDLQLVKIKDGPILIGKPYREKIEF